MKRLTILRNNYINLPKQAQRVLINFLFLFCRLKEKLPLMWSAILLGNLAVH